MPLIYRAEASDEVETSTATKATTSTAVASKIQAETATSAAGTKAATTSAAVAVQSSSSSSGGSDTGVMDGVKGANDVCSTKGYGSAECSNAGSQVWNQYKGVILGCGESSVFMGA